MSVLRGTRVLDLGGDDAPLAGQILADLGADVVAVDLVERASGARPPWPRDDAGRSFFQRAYARNKRTLTAAADELPDLIARADVLIESFDPDTAQRLGLAPDALAASHPALIHASVTPFGCTGPKAGYQATDLTVMAASGFLFLSGAPGRAPLRISAPQAHAHAGADAAVAVLTALRERARSGCGQHLDVSAQESLTLALLGRALDAPLGQPATQRSAGRATIGTFEVRYLYPARDGWVLAQPGILPPLAAFQRRLVDWAVDEGLLDARFRALDWGTAAFRMMAGTLDPYEWTALDGAVEQLLARRTKAEIMDEAVRRKLLLAPVFHVGDLLDSPQFAARDFVRGDGRHGRFPGPFAQLARSPIDPTAQSGVADRRGLLTEWAARAPAPKPTGTSAPLAGLKVVDLFWVVAGPGATRLLADQGATVVHVESSARLDMARSVPPYIEGVVEPERAALFHTINANKLDLALDLTSEPGRAVLRDLIAWADVLTESFSPGVIERLGFDYATVRAINPKIIMISSCLLGQSGPWKDYAGFGNLAAAVSGFHELTGAPGEPPAGCYGPYTDFIGVRYNAAAILGALAHRDRTGEGQFIDMAQAEAALHFLAPQAQAYLESGRVPAALGNRDPDMAPHGVFPCRGEDRWVAIAVRTDAEWLTFCDCAGLVDLARDPGLAHLAGRQVEENRIEARIAAWTGAHTPQEIETRLQAAGIAAHAVLDTHDLARDPMLAHRGHFLRIPHPLFGTTVIESHRVVYSRTPARIPERAPTYGSDRDTVLRGFLGYDADRIAQLEALGVLK